MESRKQKTKEDMRKSLIDEVKKTKNLTDVEAMKESMNKIKEISENLELQTIQKFTILFYSYYNHLTDKNEYTEKLIYISLFMIDNFNRENILELIQSEILKIFPKYNMLSSFDKIDDYIMCYNLCLLSKNIDLMIIYFEDCLNASIFDSVVYKHLNLENPFTEELFNSIFISIYEKMHENKLEDINLIIKNYFDNPKPSINNILRCDKCFNIMKMKMNTENKIEMQCDNCDNNYKEYTESELLDTNNTKFNCYECECNIILYEDNYKCTTCKNIICSKCKNQHFKNCFSLNYLNLYEVGTICEIHDINYVEYCFECQKNICEKCKEIHIHKTESNISVINELNKNITLYMKNNGENKKYKSEEEIIKNSIVKLYLKLKKKELFNGFLIEILCQIFKINISETKNNILFSEFNDENFRNYYSKLFTKISEGNIYYLDHLEYIQSFYKGKVINSYQYPNKLIVNREKSVALLIELCKSFLNYLASDHRFLNYDTKINNLRLQNDDLKIKINEIKLELLQTKNTNKLLREDAHNILSRFLVDELLKIIIFKFQDKLDKVALKINLILDIIYEHGENMILNDDILDKIEKISDNFSKIIKELKQNPKNKELKEKLINILESSSKINFVEDVTIGNETFNKKELNEILDVLYYIKKQGNQSAHPNIKSNEYINFKKIDKLPLTLEEKSESFYKDELEEKVKKEINNKLGKKLKKKCAKSIIDIIKFNDSDDDDKSKYYNFNEFNLDDEEIIKEYNILSNLGNYDNLVKKKIQEKIANFRNELLERFDNNIMKNKTSVSEIIEVIFEGKDEIIFNKANNFFKILLEDTDNVINKNYCVNFLKKFTDENKNLNALKNWLKDIKNILSGIDWLKILKHKNIEKIIEQKIVEHSDNFSSYISFIIFLESLKISEVYINCSKNDLIAEACILLLTKIYNKEIKFYSYVIKTYENLLLKNLVYEEISSKLNEIRILFEKSLVNKKGILLTEIIKQYMLKKGYKLSIDDIKYILERIINVKEIELNKNERFNLIGKLFCLQNYNL